MDNTSIQKPRPCSRCQVTKELAEFGKNARAYDGLDSYCRACVREISRERRKKNQATVEPRVEGTKRCSRCKQTLDVGCFGIDRGRGDGLQPACKDCYRVWQKELYERRKQAYVLIEEGTRRCPACKQVLPVTEFRVERGMKDGRSCWCRSCSAKRHQELRIEVLGHYAGGQPACACCKEMILEFLSVDHVNGGGSEHRKVGLKGATIYRWLKKEGYPEGYQVLCHNCNQAKGFYGECPHQRQR